MQKYCVQFGDGTSDYFSVGNGVKQGGILSPILFTMYIDVLIEKLRHSGVGCYLGNTFAGALGYADDIILLAPTQFAMRKMLSICEEFSREYGLLFNSDKSKIIVFGTEVQPVFHLNGKNIDVVKNESHLGNIFGYNSNQKQIEKSVKDLYKNFNILMAQFSHVSMAVKYKLFRSFCMSVYGAALWNFESRNCESFYVAWRKCIKRLFGIPQRTHSYLISHICCDFPVNVQLHCRFVNFVESCIASKNELVRVACCIGIANPNSNIASSNSFINSKYSLTDMKNRKTQIQNVYQTNVDTNQMREGTLVRDMLDLFYECNDYDILDIIEDICCN